MFKKVCHVFTENDTPPATHDTHDTLFIALSGPRDIGAGMIEIYVIRKDELILIKPLEERITIGSDPKCDVSLPDSLNPMHASIEAVGNKIYLKELNGEAYFNGQRISGSISLKPKDIFDLGDYRFQINKKAPTSGSHTSNTVTGTHNSSGESGPDEIPNITLLKPQKKTFCQLNILIGRSSDCHVKIPDDSVTRKNVSRHHAEIYVKNGLYYIRDLNSKNGTTLFDFSIDGRPLPRRGTICLGQYELPYEIEEKTALAVGGEGILIPSINPNLSPKRLIGNSPAIRVLKDKLDRALPSDNTVLITGENGTGKELCARYLHFYHPKRNNGPFIAVNCASIPKQLAESFLFGHMKGSFTGAVNNSQGVFAQAQGGTLFLDEIGELSLEMQAQLLRVIEDGLVRPLGSNKETPVDVRVIFATNKDIEAERKKGTFRNDLFYRCQNFIRVPSLRERKSDINMLVNYFLSNSGRPLEITPGAFETLEIYPWPGNIRELSAAVERAILNVSCRGSTVITENDFDLEKDISVYTDHNFKIAPVALKEQIIKLLKESEGNVSYAADVLKMERKTLYRKMRSFKIDPTIFRK